MKRERKDTKEKSIDFLYFGSFLIVLSDSEVRFEKINIKRIGSVDFQPILTILIHFQKFNLSTSASYLAPRLSGVQAIDAHRLRVSKNDMWLCG